MVMPRVNPSKSKMCLDGTRKVRARCLIADPCCANAHAHPLFLTEVCAWLDEIAEQPRSTVDLFRQHRIDGGVLLSLTERDLRSPPLNMKVGSGRPLPCMCGSLHCHHVPCVVPLQVFGDMRRLARSIDGLRFELGVNQEPVMHQVRRATRVSIPTSGVPFVFGQHWAHSDDSDSDTGLYPSPRGQQV